VNSAVNISTSKIFKKYKEKGAFGLFLVDRIREFKFWSVCCGDHNRCDSEYQYFAHKL
jgi:hypothetical protein